MTILRLKAVRKLEQRISKVKELMDMYNVNPSSSSNRNIATGYQPTGGSSLVSNLPLDPKTQKIRDLFEMFHLTR